jgi:hypothetical protein
MTKKHWLAAWHAAAAAWAASGSGGREWRATAARCRRQLETDPAYIHQLTDEYRWVVPHHLYHHVFLGATTSPTNIIYVYPLVMWLQR